jgi:NADPH:quinone reductase-like Zn-dependent oxidoreductase
MGFEVAAIARGADKAELAKKLGADYYIDSAATDPVAALQALGGTQVILGSSEVPNLRRISLHNVRIPKRLIQETKAQRYSGERPGRREGRTLAPVSPLLGRVIAYLGSSSQSIEN